ncbi:MAG: RimK family alpha-L-glutamate ligase [Bdellovibrionaceae bacterium]|nr:RimK family alpha-L-glutamate ligase [Pseudobdellovibrionaceae bacterium]
MKLKILASTAQAESTLLIQKAAQSLGIDFEVLLLDHIQTSAGAIFHQNVELVGSPDLMIWLRLGTLSRRRGLEIARLMQMRGLRLINSAEAVELASDKIESYERLHKIGAPVPRTWPFSPEIRIRASELHHVKPRSPVSFWIKTRIGSQGIGVSWAADATHALAQMDLIRVSEGSGVIQEHVPGEDLRLLVCEGRILGAMKRTAAAGEFRANLHQGAKAEPTEPTPAEAALALRTTHAMNLRVAGVDMIRHENSAVVLEVNPSPGLAGISACLGKNLAVEILTNFKTNS